MKLISRILMRALVLGAIALLPSCALLKKPLPVTQLQLALDATRMQMPPDMQVKTLKARAILQTDRVIVIQGAQVMQHAGVRWVAEPAALLREELSMMGADVSARLGKNRAAPEKPVQLEIWLHDFNIEVLAGGDTRILVSARANIQCIGAAKSAPLPVAAFSVPLNSVDPQRIAEGFNAAASSTFRTLLASGAEYCRALKR